MSTLIDVIFNFLTTGLYRKIVSYVLLRSGLGSPTDIAVVREATGTSLYCRLLKPETDTGLSYDLCSLNPLLATSKITVHRIFTNQVLNPTQ